MELKPETILNNLYRVDKLLGKGAMGNVYLVERVPDNKKFVVKELKFTSETKLNQDMAKEIFFREAEFIAKFDHTGLPKMYGIFSQDGHDYLTMEYIKGKTLEEIINESKKPLSLEQSLRWTIEIAEILHYLHYSFENPIVYKDLKPANIMITEEQKVKLIDFGVARYYSQGKDTDTFRLGSPGYAAPEQYKGKGQSSPQVDIFALGVILFQMITKYDPTITPFKFPPIRSLNPSISSELEAIIMKAIEPDAKKRYKNIMEFEPVIGKYIRDHFAHKVKDNIITETTIAIKEKKPKKKHKEKFEKKKKEHIKKSVESSQVENLGKKPEISSSTILIALITFAIAIILPTIAGAGDPNSVPIVIIFMFVVFIFFMRIKNWH